MVLGWKTGEDRGYNCTLDIGQFDKDKHQGQYSLEVCNSVGCESAYINLTAAGPPLTPIQLQTFGNVTKTSIWLSWRPNFPGGDYTQEFILESRTAGGDWKVFGSFSDTKEDVMVVEVNNLRPGTLYEFRMYAKNTRVTKNRSGYTHILQEKTKDEPNNLSAPSNIVGAVVGAISAVLVIAVVVVGAILFYKKGYRCAITKNDNQQAAQVAGNEVDNSAYADIGPGDNQATSTYSGLQHKTSPEYTELRHYKNTRGFVPEDKNLYDGLQERSPASYETVAVHPYDNMKREDPAYVNTLRAIK